MVRGFTSGVNTCDACTTQVHLLICRNELSDTANDEGVFFDLTLEGSPLVPNFLVKERELCHG